MPKPRRRGAAAAGDHAARCYPLTSTTRRQATGSPKRSARISADRVRHTGPAPASEDFGCFGTEWHAPSVFWFVGGTDPAVYAKARAEGRINELPVNHSPHFAPVIHPTLRNRSGGHGGAALAWNAVR